MPIRILIVDDDPVFRDRITAALRQQGYDVVGTAHSIAEARASVTDLEPDALLLDVNLPDGDGIAFAFEVVAAGRAPQILLTSTDPAAAPAGLVRRSGAAGFIPKVDLAATDLGPLLGSSRRA